MPDPSLRPTAVRDLPRVVDLEAAADTATWLGETGLAWHERALADPDQDHLVFDDVTGFVVLAGLATGSIELRRIVVDPASRGTGLGRVLLHAALARAYDHHHAHHVWLDVKAHNLRAKKLYESAGFHTTHTLAGALREPDGTSTDLLVMTHTPV